MEQARSHVSTPVQSPPMTLALSALGPSSPGSHAPTLDFYARTADRFAQSLLRNETGAFGVVQHHAPQLSENF